MTAYDSAVLALSGIARYWPLDDTSGSTADDRTNTADGSYVGTSVTLAAGAGLLAGQSGIETTGTGEATLPISGLTGNGSIGFWYYVAPGAVSFWVLRDHGSGILFNPNSPEIRLGGTTHSITGASPRRFLSGRKFVVFTMSGTQLKVYLDGELIQTFSNTTTLSSLNSPLHVGRNGTVSQYTPGRYAGAFVTTSVLSDADVLALYKAGRSPQVTIRNAGTVTSSTGSTLTPTLPAHVTGDMLVLAVIAKPDTFASSPSIDQGWTYVDRHTGGTGTNGADTGPMSAFVFMKVAASSSEAAPTVTWGDTPSPALYRVYSLIPDADYGWADSPSLNPGWVRSASDTDTASPFTGTTSSFGDAPLPGDLVISVGGGASDAGSPLASQSLSIAGLSGLVDAIPSRTGTPSGNDAVYLDNFLYPYSGTASAGAAASYTITSGTNHSGVLLAIAVRQESTAASSVILGGVAPTAVADFDVVRPASTVAGGGIAPAPVAAFALQALTATLALGGVAPAPVASFQILDDSTGLVSLTGVAPDPVSAFTVTRTASTLATAGVAPVPTAAFAITRSASSVVLGGVAPAAVAGFSIDAEVVVGGDGYTCLDLSTGVILFDSGTHDTGRIDPTPGERLTVVFDGIPFEITKSYLLRYGFEGGDYALTTDPDSRKEYGFLSSVDPTAAEAEWPDRFLFHDAVGPHANPGFMPVVDDPGIPTFADAMAVGADKFYVVLPRDASLLELCWVDTEILEDVPVETDTDLVGVDEVDQEAWDDEWHAYPTVTPLPFPDMWSAWDVAFVLTEDGTKVEKRRARLRDRIVVGGTDITFVNGVRTPVPDYSREKPFSFSAMTLEVPGVNPLTTLLSSLPWFGRHKKVLVQRVNTDDEVVVTDYRGVTLDPTGDGAGLTLGVGGLFTGKAAKSWRGWTQRRKADPVYWLHALMRGLGMPLANDWSFGIDMITPAPGWRSDVGFQIVSESRKRGGSQLTVRYDEDVHQYIAETVDRETIHLTAYLDHGQMRQNLVCDWSNDPTEVFARGYLDSGEKFINIVAPNMTVYETTPDYPIAGGDPFGLGTEDADTTDGAGISRLILRLIGFRFLKRDDKAGGYDADVERAVTNARIAARMDDYGTGDPMLKMVDEDLWAWLFDADGAGLTMKEARERPIYEVPELGKYDLTASGDLRGLNANYDASVPRISEVIDFSTSMDDVSDLTEASRSYIPDPNTPNWAGTITTQHGFIDGEHNPGDAFDESMIVSNRDVREGMNLWVPNWQGGTLFHVVQVDISDDGFVASLKVDTRARDAITLDAILDRNERYRRGAAKAYMEERRQSSYDKNAILGYFGRFGGKLTADEVLTGGSWNVFWVPLGDYGLVQRFRTRVRAIGEDPYEFFEGSNPFAGADGLEHYVRIFGEKVTPAWMNAREPDPSAAIATAAADYKAAVDDYKTRGRLAAYGATSVDDSPCGYGEDYKDDDGATLSGNFFDDSGFPFRAPDCRAWVAVWVPEDAVQLAGWMFRWQVDEGT